MELKIGKEYDVTMVNGFPHRIKVLSEEENGWYVVQDVGGPIERRYSLSLKHVVTAAEIRHVVSSPEEILEGRRTSLQWEIQWAEQRLKEERKKVRKHTWEFGCAALGSGAIIWLFYKVLFLIASELNMPVESFLRNFSLLLFGFFLVYSIFIFIALPEQKNIRSTKAQIQEFKEKLRNLR